MSDRRQSLTDGDMTSERVDRRSFVAKAIGRSALALFGSALAQACSEESTGSQTGTRIVSRSDSCDSDITDADVTRQADPVGGGSDSDTGQRADPVGRGTDSDVTVEADPAADRCDSD